MKKQRGHWISEEMLSERLAEGRERLLAAARSALEAGREFPPTILFFLPDGSCEGLAAPVSDYQEKYAARDVVRRRARALQARAILLLMDCWASTYEGKTPDDAPVPADDPHHREAISLSTMRPSGVETEHHFYRREAGGIVWEERLREERVTSHAWNPWRHVA